MITRDTAAFTERFLQTPADVGPATARAAFMIAPDGFALAEQSAQDNTYMADAAAFDAARASAQHRDLQRALSSVVPTICFAGREDTPDALFPNNVFGTTQGHYIVGRMRHEVRQREAHREDIRGFFQQVLGYRAVTLDTQSHPCELTGSIIIDRARGLGFCGLSERCDEAGARLMHDAFGLRATLMFDLAPSEYHTNVVLSVLASRAVVVCPQGFADPQVAHAIAALYAPHAVVCTPEEHAAFVGNCIAVSNDVVWMSANAGQALLPEHRQVLADAGFQVRTVALDAIEAAGGSLRCCVGEIF